MNTSESIAALRNLDGRKLRADEVQAVLDIAGRLVAEHAESCPEYDMTTATQCADEAADAFREAELIGEPAIVLHRERVAAASMGGVL